MFKVCNNGPAADGVNKATREDIDPIIGSNRIQLTSITHIRFYITTSSSLYIDYPPGDSLDVIDNIRYCCHMILTEIGCCDCFGVNQLSMDK